MAFSNDIFHFYEYVFEEPQNYNSLKLVKYKAYRIAPEEIHLSEIIILLKNLNNNSTISKAPFPQADNFNRVIDLF
jgi:hypothetical protein